MTILLISSDSIDTQMAGPGIRYWEFATRLSQAHTVILLTPNVSALRHPNVEVVPRTTAAMRRAIQRADVIVTQGFLFPIASLLLCRKPLVVDLYDPLPIELLEHHAHLPLNAAQLSQSYCVARTLLLLQRGDLFLYSHDRQRDYWLGLLTAVGRVNHQQYRTHPDYVHLFARVPFGLPDEPPTLTSNLFRGEGGLFRVADTVILWGGGLWNWFDPCSVIRAMRDIAAMRDDIKLLFLGVKRAVSDTTGIRIAYATQEAMALSEQFGLSNRTVFFSEKWLPYHERQNVFLEANIGISTHFDRIETHFSFRTRLLDYLWTGLPIITTRGDYLSELVERERLGIVVEPQDVGQIKEAILRLTDDQAFIQQCRTNIARLRPEFAWQRVMQPLEAFCAAPTCTHRMSLLTRLFALSGLYAKTGWYLLAYRGYQKIFQKMCALFSLPKNQSQRD